MVSINRLAVYLWFCILGAKISSLLGLASPTEAMTAPAIEEL